MADLSYIESNRIIREIAENADRVAAEVAVERKNLKKSAWLYGLPTVGILCVCAPQAAGLWIGAFCFMLLITYASGNWRMSAAQAGDPVSVAGAVGELAVLEALEDLPDNYVVLNQILVPDSRSSVGHREIDYIVVGPNGAFILEAKSYKGHVSGGENDSDWKIFKVGRGGTPYWSSCRNAAKQTRIYIRLLSDALKAKGERVWLNGLVVMARDNDLSDIQVTSVGITQVGDVVNYLRTFNGKTVANPKAVAGVIRQVSEEAKKLS